MKRLLETVRVYVACRTCDRQFECTGMLLTCPRPQCPGCQQKENA